MLAPRRRPEELEQFQPGEPSGAVRDRVRTARSRQGERFGGTSFQCNADMRAAAMSEFRRVTEDVASLLRAAVDQFGLTARAYQRVLKMARTIGDLGGADGLMVHHVAEAVQYRTLDRKLWTQ